MTVYRQAFFAGRVQGVGFRYSVKQIATGYEVVGWVRNLPDGRVEVQVGGESGEVEKFFQAICDSHLSNHIKEFHQAERSPPAAGWTGFEIRA